MRARPWLMMLTPLACAAVIFAGARIAAPRPVHAASVEARAIGGDGRALHLAVLTYLDDTGVREAAALDGVRVTAQSAAGPRAEWTGRCDGEGICEARLAFDAAPESPVLVRVEHEGEDAPLAEGSFDLRALEGPTTSAATPWARAAGRSGALVVDVAALDGTVAPEVAVPIAVRVQREGHLVAGATLTLEPGGGSEIVGASEPTCVGGITTARMLVRGPIAELRVTATSGDARGEWFGALPLTPGASHGELSRQIAEGAPSKGSILVPSPRGAAYVELWDERGAVLVTRVVAAPAPGEIPSAPIDLPPLARGPHWLVTAAKPRGAVALEGATRSQPLLVTRAPIDACALTGALLGQRAFAFPRSAPLDGIAVRRRGDVARSRLGRGMALAALSVGAALELLLLVFGVRRSERDLAAVERELAASAGPLPVARWVSLTVTVLLTVLGFLLLAALVAYKGS